MNDAQVARQKNFSEMPAALGGIAVWLYVLIAQGLVPALELLPLLLIALSLGGTMLLPRLRFTNSQLSRTIGLWRQAVDLRCLESINWKMTGGWRSAGSLFVRDRNGHTVVIWVGRFTRGPSGLRSC